MMHHPITIWVCYPDHIQLLFTVFRGLHRSSHATKNANCYGICAAYLAASLAISLIDSRTAVCSLFLKGNQLALGESTFEQLWHLTNISLNTYICIAVCACRLKSVHGHYWSKDSAGSLSAVNSGRGYRSGWIFCREHGGQEFGRKLEQVGGGSHTALHVHIPQRTNKHAYTHFICTFLATSAPSI